MFLNYIILCIIHIYILSYIYLWFHSVCICLQSVPQTILNIFNPAIETADFSSSKLPQRAELRRIRRGSAERLRSVARRCSEWPVVETFSRAANSLELSHLDMMSYYIILNYVILYHIILYWIELYYILSYMILNDIIRY